MKGFYQAVFTGPTPEQEAAIARRIKAEEKYMRSLRLHEVLYGREAGLAWAERMYLRLHKKAERR